MSFVVHERNSCASNDVLDIRSEENDQKRMQSKTELIRYRGVWNTVGWCYHMRDRAVGLEKR